MRGGLAGGPVRRHGREEVRRNLLRLVAYQDLVLDDRSRPPAGPVPASPVACVSEGLAVLTVLFARRGEGRGEGGGGGDGVADYFAYLVALLARIAFPHAPERVGRVVFFGHVAAALEGAASLEHGWRALRGELVAVLGRLGGRALSAGRGRARGGGRSLQALVVGLGARVYYLGDSLGVYRRLAPPRTLACPTSTTTPRPSPRRGVRAG